MSGGKQLHNAALGGCLAALLLVAPALAQQDVEEPSAAIDEGQGVTGEPPPPEEEGGDSAELERSPPADPLPPPPPVESEISAEPACGPRCEAAQQRENSDLIAQESMADSTKEIAGLTEWQLYVGGFGILLLVGTLLLTIKSTNAAIQANRIARESAERQLRAYVCVTVVRLRFYGHRVRATTVVTNHGTTPAYALRTQSGLMLAPFPSDTPFEGWNDSAEDESVAIVGPEQPSEDFNEIAITNDQHDALRAGDMALYAFGEYRYRDAFKRDRFIKYRFMVGGDTGFNTETMSACKEGNEAN